MKTLHNYQFGAADAVQLERERGAKRALIVMATGLGKTVIAAEISRRELVADPSAKIVFMAHRVDILKQARKEFVDRCGHLVETGIISSDVVENPHAQMLFITFQSMEGRREQYGADRFKLVIVDEAHHSWAETFYATLMYFTPEFMLGMTATEGRTDGLDIREIFGEPVYSYPLKRAIEDGWLAEVVYHVLTDHVDVAKLRELIGLVVRGSRKITRAQLDAQVFLAEHVDKQVEIIRKHQEGGKRTAVFCRDLEDLKHFHALMPGAVPYHSEVDASERPEVLEGFRNGTVQTMLAIDMLNEGVDVPDIELVVFRRGTQSVTLWLQQLGRGTRLTPTKRKMTVLDFVANISRVQMIAEIAGKPPEPGGGRSTPIYVEGGGWDVVFDDVIWDLYQILDRLEADFYQTIEEAMAAVKRLEIENRDQYSQMYQLDSRLPATPQRTYHNRGWVNWPHFLGKRNSLGYYATTEDAKSAVRSLGILTKSKYHARYKEDSRLPRNPQRYYDDWISWPNFLGTEPYHTLAEAMIATRSLEVVTSRQYFSRYQSDPRLIAQPDLYYKDWVSWFHYLGTNDLTGTGRGRKGRRAKRS